MAPLTAPTTLTQQVGDTAPLQYFDLPIKAATTIYGGSLVVADAGYAAPGRTATGLIAVGRAEETVANPGAAGATRIRVRRGAFAFNNSASADAIAQANFGATVYIVDDNTVALTNGTNTRSAAGKFVGFNDAGRPVVEIY
ncbi:hypothetical protein [Myxococcus phage Mx4 ts27htf-1hrm-1]|nr:hypothetical protein Mx4_p49 [Myxococcus phage Mx4]WNM70388.1 hypothetical protein [Myxococcus phage Mx4 ts27htf-1hrm-1]